jgi:hypothetical protein
MGLDRLLRHIGQHGVGAAEADHGELGKERSDAHQHVVRPERGDGQRHRRPPHDKADDHGDGELPPRVADGCRHDLDLAGQAETFRRLPRHDKSDQGCGADD